MSNFDELSFRNALIKDIREIFSLSYEDIKTEVKVISNNPQSPTYPCCLVDILEPVSAERYADTKGSYNYVDFSLNCEIYTKKLGKLNQKDLSIKLSQILIGGIGSKYQTLIVTRNSIVPYKDDVARRVVSFRGTLDVSNNTIYSN